MYQRAKFVTALNDLRAAWDTCTHAVRDDALIPGISSDTVVSRILLMLSRRYRCLARVLDPGPVRQEMLANTHSQIREIS
jgi:hypothetical protein